jgi:hypothetical protein
MESGGSLATLLAPAALPTESAANPGKTALSHFSLVLPHSLQEGELQRGIASGQETSPQATRSTIARTEQEGESSPSAMQQVPGPSWGESALSILYIFAGDHRRAGVKQCLEELQALWCFKLCMREVDILRGGEQDVQQEEFWRELMSELAAGVYDLLIVTPPCHTHSRARSSGGGRPGPRPVRSANYPWGFPWLEGKALRSCELANKLVLRTFEAIETAFNAGACHILEHPEDLGATPSGEVPAAIWQYSELRDIQLRTGAEYRAMFQCIHGALTSKPN